MLILCIGIFRYRGFESRPPRRVKPEPISNSMGARSEQDLAWAAGIFDGEGSTSTYLTKPNNIPRWQMAVSQGGLPGHTPIVLLRFKEIVRVGSITGPYDGLYYWKISTKDDVDLVGGMLWRHLSRQKRQQYAAAAIRMQRSLPGPLDDLGSRDFEAAWAAGLFDGEGTFGAYTKPHMSPSWRGAQMSIPQASATDVPETLLRFRSAVGAGTVTGPRIVPSPWSRLPQYCWQANGRHVCTAAIKVIWPWLGEVKRAQIRAALQHLDPNAEDWMIDLTA